MPFSPIFFRFLPLWYYSVFSFHPVFNHIIFLLLFNVQQNTFSSEVVRLYPFYPFSSSNAFASDFFQFPQISDKVKQKLLCKNILLIVFWKLLQKFQIDQWVKWWKVSIFRLQNLWTLLWTIWKQILVLSKNHSKSRGWLRYLNVINFKIGKLGHP